MRLLGQEIESRSPSVLSNLPTPEVHTIYFGGGTPSLLDPKHILAVKNSLSQCGFRLSTQLEWTIEINPATINPQKLADYQEMGINRFSLGVQSFNDEHLKRAGRRHTAQQTRDTLGLLKSLNYNMDLLFALPHQSEAELQRDLEEFMEWSPSHISPYCLTVPASNPMAKNRAEDEVQVKMFDQIGSVLESAGYTQYEISNYAKPGFESRHNQLYWEDENYWGIGLSSHSFLKFTDYGVRFWNPSQYAAYKAQIENSAEQHVFEGLPSSQKEVLKLHEAVTDYCHTALRTSRGLNVTKLDVKFPPATRNWVESKLKLLPLDWIQQENQTWTLSPEGKLLSNRVFEQLLMTESDSKKL